jgi:hypothetical protein
LRCGEGSFFGTQEGEFELVVRSISAVKGTGKEACESRLSKEGVLGFAGGKDEKETANSRRAVDGQENTGLLGWLSTMCVVS